MTTNNNTPDEVEPDEPATVDCDWCGNATPEFDVNSVNNGESICDDCHQDSWACDDCGHRASCSSYYSSYTVYDRRNREREVCEGCIDNYDYCDSCGNYIQNGCQDCEQEGMVHDYSYRPHPLFFVNVDGRPRTIYQENNAVFTGMELEVEVESAPYTRSAELAQEIFGELAYLKSDGSLNHGFEIVTHPFSLDFLREHLNLARLRELADLGVRSANTQTCGLHVHINRSYFRERSTSLYRLLSLLYHNSSQWIAVSGRNSTRWANWDDDNSTRRWVDYNKALRWETHRALNYENIERSNRDRYVAVNLQPRNTIELRFFKGTLNPDTLRGRLEGVHAAVLFANHTRMNFLNPKQSWDWDKFRTFAQAEGFDAFGTLCSKKGV